MAGATASVLKSGSEMSTFLASPYGANSEATTLVTIPQQTAAATDPARVTPAAINYTSWAESYAQTRSEPKTARAATTRKMRKRAKKS